MKKIISTRLLLSASICIVVLFGCKKATQDDVVSDEIQVQVQSDDAEMVSGETDAVDEDVNNAISANARFCGSGNVFGGSVMSSDADSTNPGNVANRLVITYNGTVFGCRKRTGSITIDLLYATRWIEPGATLKISFNNFKVENVCRNRSVTINGDRFITNVNGGNMFRLSQGLVSLLKHKVRNGSTGITATFTDSSGTKAANWNVAKTTSISFTPPSGGVVGKFNYEINGDTTINGKAKTEAWGTTRYGKAYQTVINSAIKANTLCRVFRPTAGSVTHTVGLLTVDVSLGLNASGNPVGAGDCATFFKVVWTNAAGVTTTKLIPYR